MDKDFMARLSALRALIRRDKAVWYCDKENCDGRPHDGYPYPHARATQHPPAEAWHEWVLLTGRGWGKTRTAAELVKEWAKTPNQQICVMGKKESLVRSICFEHKTSGLLKVIPQEYQAKYNASGGSGRFFLRLTNGSTIYGFSAEKPDNLRGFAFDKAWFDEYAAWNKTTAQDAFDQVWFAMRESPSPQMVISTTPKPVKHIRDLVAKAGVFLTRGHTKDNAPNLSEIALEKLYRDYGGTRLGAQELSGEILEDTEGALWTNLIFETPGFRVDTLPPLSDVVVAVDPAVNSTEGADFTAITVAGIAIGVPGFPELPQGYVIDSVQDHWRPVEAMTTAASLARRYGASRVVLEANNGGEYLSTVLRMVAPDIRIQTVHAVKDKRGRAMPVATLYEQGRIHHYGDGAKFEELESQMLTYTGEGREKSPDLLDSMVWALTALFLEGGGHEAVFNRRLAGRV
ncbi:terminase large subunit domain-containing protein [Mobiluncus porci]|uniref:DNA-packaging protein n=1 Tax=Mobiluncus porci TaxID=2652278 RepID=A0A7K0K0H4_9ACTO|nr:terminase family protein [Mobiluncus porci]MST48919.1 DNA-packaging protein [Mobiluncus porci]